MHSFKRFLPAILWALLLFYLSSLPSSSVPTFKIKHEDLVLHFLVYSVLGYFLGFAFVLPETDAMNKWVLIAAIVGILYGASDEFHQTFVPGRFADVSDFIADSIGVIFGLIVYRKWPGIFKLKIAQRLFS